METAILLIQCKDQMGIIAEVTQYVHMYNGNIINLEQHTDKESGDFHMRLEWDLMGYTIEKATIKFHFDQGIGKKWKMETQLYFSADTPRVAVFVSKMSHCLYDILYRVQSGEWKAELPLIISNHPNLQSIADRFGIAYHHIPISKSNKQEQEAVQRELLESHNIDLVILARYMQILTDDFASSWKNRIINIHHSFLPAFPGARPYHSAYERGVKIIGATSHYVTKDLDEGPIIAQDVTRISHVDAPKDLIKKGKDLEKLVLSRAVGLHLERKILVKGNKTVIFS
ncbi:MAG: formyltetrahydrofolate deformylase [Bacteroidota bacterium]